MPKLLQAEIPPSATAKIQAGQGRSLIQYIGTLSLCEPSVVDLKDAVQEAENRHGKMSRLQHARSKVDRSSR